MVSKDNKVLNIVEAIQAELLICRDGGQVKIIIRTEIALTLAMEEMLPPHNYGALMSAQQEENSHKIDSLQRHGGWSRDERKYRQEVGGVRSRKAE